MQNNVSTGRYDKIGPTAWGVAYHRGLSDIKYAKEIFEALDAAVHPTDPKDIDYLETSKKSGRSPQFEARYKLIDRMLTENNLSQILELAAGLAPRGLTMAEENPRITYVETDLPEMIGYKKKILQNLFAAHKINQPKNLFVEVADALDLDSLLVAVKHFKNKPIAIVHEGLLRYLDFKQKAIVAENVKTLLEKFGGVWITPDITLNRMLSLEKETEDNQRKVLDISGIDVRANAFDSETAAVQFFNRLGFKIESHPFLEVQKDLVTPKILGLSDEDVNKILGSLVVFVMKLA